MGLVGSTGCSSSYNTGVDYYKNVLEDGAVDRTRPLCPYPQVASYTGTASTDDAANFVCKAGPIR